MPAQLIWCIALVLRFTPQVSLLLLGLLTNDAFAQNMDVEQERPVWILRYSHGGIPCPKQEATRGTHGVQLDWEPELPCFFQTFVKANKLHASADDHHPESGRHPESSGLSEVSPPPFLGI